ncbi:MULTISPECIES: hypothetical protein [Vibrio]|uniref:hypothetical protein n=1 Tax=Vibrio TaxID=662 RepID=UPI000C1736A5|nr:MULTISPECIES: hypothetical protein [Vibrio]NAW69850.1 hypothetical protein [Vibrio sp. V28_P6S34P95]NAX03890.1 hypothetical protein [Vibrio sp. V30_P3S12P165]NAX33709.1 hypothetical protein [Vibrio sp. V29_P1S30P107]NAX36732.1 hypothetical protein [Vibrio sp. V27_P1S3P104]NAX40248.1 hypothetical protein [Vibrio sp. V26_P1S5P106]
MVKRLCKLNRHDIRTSMGEIQQLVMQPSYICGACARSAVDKSLLCKPQSLQIAKNDRLTQPLLSTTLGSQTSVSVLTKKTLKKQKKYQKKLAKVLKKQHKLMKKQQALQGKFTELKLLPLNDEISLTQFH